MVPAWALALVTRTLPRFIGTAAGLLVGGILALGRDPVLDRTLWSAAGCVSSSAQALHGALLDWQYLETHGWWSALAMTVGRRSRSCVGHYRHRRSP